VSEAGLRTLRVTAILGLAATALVGGVFLLSLSPVEVQSLRAPGVWPWSLVAAAGFTAQAVLWTWGLVRAGDFERPGAWMTTLMGALGLTLLATACVRECIRLSRIEIATFIKAHEASAFVGGLWVFLLFFVVNAGLIAWLFLRVGRDLRMKPAT
jgi:hypothetical protein